MARPNKPQGQKPAEPQVFTNTPAEIAAAEQSSFGGPGRPDYAGGKGNEGIGNIPEKGTPAGGGSDTQSSEDAYWDWRRQQDEAANASARRAVIAEVQGIFAQYGLSSLYGRIVEYAQAGYNAASIALMLRETPEYAQRFPAMQSLAAKGRAISEAEYVGYEQFAASLETRFGVPKGMLMGQVTNLLTNEVSANELQDRVTLASADALTAPDDLKQQMQDYFGVGQDALTAYYLDPTIAMPLLEKQSAMARIGTQAARQYVQINAQTAQGLQELGVSEQQAQQGFGQVRRQTTFTEGRGETTTQAGLISGTFGNEDAAAKTQRIAASRTGRFQEGGGFVGSQSGVTGIGSGAST